MSATSTCTWDTFYSAVLARGSVENPGSWSRTHTAIQTLVQRLTCVCTRAACRCTWDAFYSTVSARGLVEGLGSLAAGGLAPQLLIIDDGWQVRHLLLCVICHTGNLLLLSALGLLLSAYSARSIGLPVSVSCTFACVLTASCGL
jgi:hypothetical protein